MWLRKNKGKLIAAVIVVAVLAAAFYIGGSAPDSRGWKPGGDGTDTAAVPAATAPQTAERQENSPAPESTPAPTAPPETTPEPEVTPEAQNAPGQEPALPTEEPGPEPTPAAETETPVPEPSPDPTMAPDPVTGLGQFLTGPVPEGRPAPVEPQDVVIGSAEYSCTISISCATILDNLDYCDPDKRELVPEDGWILQPVTVTFHEGESVFNLLQRVCKQQGIHMEYMDTPIYNSAYIEGIGNLYEFDVGELSGWMYKVNGWFPNYGCSRYQLRDGDVIAWVYTCDLGADVGGAYSAGG